jgi:hypothetical protein
MDRRSSKRKIVSIIGELISNGNHYKGHIENVSENGIFMNIANTKSAVDFIPSVTPEVRFKLPSGNVLNLQCEIKWLHTYKTTSHGLMNSMGMEIKDPPVEYKEFIKSLK